MRQLFFLALLLLLLPDPVAAQPATGVLRVRFDDHYPATVAVNNRHFRKAGRALTIGDLPRGRSLVKVYTYRAYRDGGGHARLVYEGRVRIHPGMVTYCIVERSTGRALIYTRDPGGSGVYQDPGFDGQTAAGAQAAEALGSAPAITGESPDAAPRPALTATGLKELEKQVNSRIADEDKLQLMQEFLEGLSVSTAQVKEMLFWLGAESTRLAFATWAYDRVSDPGEYKQLEAVFIYSSSKEAFNEHIN